MLSNSEFNKFGGSSNLPPGCSQEDCDGNAEFNKYYAECNIAFWCDDLEEFQKIMNAMESAISTHNGELDYVEVETTQE